MARTAPNINVYLRMLKHVGRFRVEVFGYWLNITNNTFPMRGRVGIYPTYLIDTYVTWLSSSNTYFSCTYSGALLLPPIHPESLLSEALAGVSRPLATKGTVFFLLSLALISPSQTSYSASRVSLVSVVSFLPMLLQLLRLPMLKVRWNLRPLSSP